MNPMLPFRPLVLLVTSMLAGFAVGLLYFEALRRTVARFARRNGWLEPAALTVGRIAAAAGALGIAARAGATELLMTFVGFLLARTVALYRSKKAI